MNGEDRRSLKHDKRVVYALSFLSVVLTAALAVAAEMPDALGVAERVEKLGPIGILAALLVVSVSANVWQMRVIIMKITALCEQTCKTMEHVSVVIENCGRKE